MHRSSSLIVLALLSVAAGGGWRLYRNDAMRVHAFEPPAGWELAPQSSYPRLLASYTHGEGARMTLAAQHVGPSTTAAQLAEQSRVPLQKQGFTISAVDASNEGWAWLDARLERDNRFARQAYTVDHDIGYVITVVGPTARQNMLSRDLDEAARSLHLVGVTPEAPRTDGGVAR